MEPIRLTLLIWQLLRLKMMINDIVVDNSVTYRFKNPPDPDYKDFINWLISEGYLVISQKLLIGIT